MAIDYYLLLAFVVDGFGGGVLLAFIPRAHQF